jgi:hypothetical protein
MVNLSEQKYSIIWSFNPSGTYSPKHGYTDLILEHIDEPSPLWGTKIWKLKCLEKAKLFMWHLLTNKSPTWENIHKRSFIEPSRVALFKQENENIPHLFLHFSFSNVVWEDIYSMLDISYIWEGSSI